VGICEAMLCRVGLGNERYGQEKEDVRSMYGSNMYTLLHMEDFDTQPS
jgi:hypothetical protein